MNGYPNLPGYKAPGTSEAAAFSMDAIAPKLRDRVLAYLKQCGAMGCTPDECADAIGETVLAVRPRFSELKNMQLIRETKLTKPNASGRAASVYCLEALYGR